MKRSTVRWWAGSVVLGLVGFVAVSIAVGLRLAAPAPARMPPPPEGAEAVVIPGDSGSGLRGWYWPGEGCGAVVLMHHVRGNRTAMLGRAAFLHEKGYGVLAFDFQAHGESLGRRITFGVLESEDAAAAVRFLRRRRPGEPIAAIGTSLGGAAALVGEEPLPVDGMVLEAVYPDLRRAIDRRIRLRLGPLSRLLTPILLLELRPLLGFGPDRLRPVRDISRVGCPLLVVGGSEDRHTTREDTLELFEAAPEPKELWMVEGAGHVDFLELDPAGYRDRVGRFVEGVLRCAST